MYGLYNVSGKTDIFGTEFLLPWTSDMSFAMAYIRAGSRNVNLSANGLTTPLSVPAFDVINPTFYNNRPEAEVRHLIKKIYDYTDLLENIEYN